VSSCGSCEGGRAGRRTESPGRWAASPRAKSPRQAPTAAATDGTIFQKVRPTVRPCRGGRHLGESRELTRMCRGSCWTRSSSPARTNTGPPPLRGPRGGSLGGTALRPRTHQVRAGWQGPGPRGPRLRFQGRRVDPILPAQAARARRPRRLHPGRQQPPAGSDGALCRSARTSRGAGGGGGGVAA
jgi:hypothetical protein